MITELTEAQTRMMPHYVDKWITVGMDTNRIDHDRASVAINAMYKNADLSPPKEILFADGPQAGFDLYMKLGGSNVNNFLGGIMFGNHEAHWLSLYDYFHHEVGVKNLEKVFPLIEVAKSCGWVYCAADTAIVMDRPDHVKMDEQNRLHCENGPAILYPDGFTVYSWHGVRIPGEWIENRASLTAAVALKVENIEQRRAACEILGWASVIEQLDCKVIDEDADPMIGTLLEVDIPDVGRERFLKVVCGTGRTFCLCVPPDMKTAMQAQAWTYDLPLDVYDQGPEVRT
jgi:hypothetical protein